MTHLVHAIHLSFCGIERHHNLWFPRLYIKIVIVMHRAQNNNMLFYLIYTQQLRVSFVSRRWHLPSLVLVQFETLVAKRVCSSLLFQQVSYCWPGDVLNSMSVKKLSTVRFLPLPKQGDARAIAVFLPMFFFPLLPVSSQVRISVKRETILGIATSENFNPILIRL